jgi:IS30 family transposase
MRQAKGGTTKSGLGQIVDAACIRERPAEARDRAVPGHWGGDLLSGANNTHIATLVERHSRFTMLLKVPNKSTASVVAAFILTGPAQTGAKREDAATSTAVARKKAR